MQALFHVDNVYRDSDKTKLVLQDNVIQGIVHSNMTLLIPLNKSFDVIAHIVLTESGDTQDNRL